MKLNAGQLDLFVQEFKHVKLAKVEALSVKTKDTINSKMKNNENDILRYDLDSVCLVDYVGWTLPETQLEVAV